MGVTNRAVLSAQKALGALTNSICNDVHLRRAHITGHDIGCQVCGIGQRSKADEKDKADVKAQEKPERNKPHAARHQKLVPEIQEKMCVVWDIHAQQIVGSTHSSTYEGQRSHYPLRARALFLLLIVVIEVVSEGWRIAPLDITRASTHGALQSGYLLPHLLLHLQTVATTLIIALTILLVTSLWQVCELHDDLFWCEHLLW